MIRTDVRLGWKSIPGHRHLVEGRENEDAVLTTEEHPYFDALMLLAADELAELRTSRLPGLW